MAETKASLLAYMSALDIATLEKLKKYSEYLIIPDESLLTSVTMQQMLTEAHTLADSLFPEWTDRSKSDFGEFLVELFSLFSEKDFWYINAFANESILRKMRSYSNAFSKASSLGYYPKLCKGSSAQFNVTFAAGEAITYGRGELVINVGSLTFSNDAEFTLATSASPISQTLTLQEGKQVSEDITYNGHNIFIKKEKVDIDSIKVIINNIEYTQVRNFGNSLASSTHFLVLPEEDGSCAIYFGSGGYGVQPAIGTTIYVEYRTCDGSEGNITLTTEVQETVSISDSIGEREATAALLTSNATGGIDAETLTSIKEHASSVSTTLKAAFNEASAEEILNTYPFIKKSNITVLGKEVYYQAIPTSGNQQLSTDEANQLVQEFEPCLMLGYIGVATANTYRDFITTAGEETRPEGSTLTGSKVILNVIVSAGTNVTTVEVALRQILADMTDPLVDAEYGGSFVKNTVESLMRSRVSGVQSVAYYVKFSDNSTVVIEDFQIGAREIFSKINQSNVIININAI